MDSGCYSKVPQPSQTGYSRTLTATTTVEVPVKVVVLQIPVWLTGFDGDQVMSGDDFVDAIYRRVAGFASYLFDSISVPNVSSFLQEKLNERDLSREIFSNRPPLSFTTIAENMVRSDYRIYHILCIIIYLRKIVVTTRWRYWKVKNYSHPWL